MKPVSPFKLLTGAACETGIGVGSSPRSLDVDIPGATVSGPVSVRKLRFRAPVLLGRHSVLTEAGPFRTAN